MEPLTTERQAETTGQKASLFAPLFRVTPLSKYFALALFLVMPFVGGVVGYWYAAQNNEVYTAIHSDDIDWALPGINTPIREDSKSYEISVALDSHVAQGTTVQISRNLVDSDGRDYLISYDELLKEGLLTEQQNNGYNLHITEVGPTQTFVAISSGGATVSAFLYDEREQKVIRKVNPEIYYNPAVFGLVSWVSYGYNTFQVSVLGPSVVVYDYLTGKEETIYTEMRPEMSLTAGCEVGCVGLLYGNYAGRIYVGAYRDSVFQEAIELELPEEFRKL